MVGAVRFELTTSWTRTTRASQATLRPGPSEPELAHRRAVLQRESLRKPVSAIYSREYRNPQAGAPHGYQFNVLNRLRGCGVLGDLADHPVGLLLPLGKTPSLGL